MNTILSEDYYKRILTHYANLADESFVLKNAIPIPYFGDVTKYMASPIKIVTVGLNPSDKEFSEIRFSVKEGLSSPYGLETELSAYFEKNPYMRWFSHYNYVLAGLDASYYSGAVNTALHCDICSPVATNPTWSKLDTASRAKLQNEGRYLFNAFLTEAKPDIIIASVNEHHMSFFGGREAKKVGTWKELMRYDTAITGKILPRPLSVRHIAYKEKSLVVYAPAAQTPFGRFSTQRKIETGRAIAEHYRLSSDFQ